MSPVGASIYCSPHPAALQIDPPPGFRNLPLDFAHEEYFQRQKLITQLKIAKAAFSSIREYVKKTS